MQRIAIIGSGGSGKSTFARQLGDLLEIEVTHLDALFWKPGWLETPREEWEAIQRGLVARDRWIMDGNYGGTMDLRLDAADTAIFLDLPRHVCLWRVISRRIRYAGRSRPDMAPGCEERLTWEFLRWIWTFPAERRPGILQRLSAHAPDTRIIRLRSAREVSCFLTSVRKHRS
ncbi:MAG: DNA topology modulation protein [Dehalococcoidia bacterium]